MPVLLHRDDGKATRREQLLAVHQLWRDLERQPPAGAARAETPVEVTHAELIRALEELIAALDRRVPRVEQAGEPDIARDAAALRARAVERLQQLQAAQVTTL